MDAVVKIIKSHKNIEINIETFTILGKVHTVDAVYNSVLRTSLDLPNLSFLLTDVEDEYYELLVLAIEKQIKRLKGHFPSMQIEFEIPEITEFLKNSTIGIFSHPYLP